MKFLCLLLCLAFLSCGCAQKVEYESVQSCGTEFEYVDDVMQISLPGCAFDMVIETDNDKIYFCDGYYISTQVFQETDLNETLQSCTGFDKDSLDLIETKSNEMVRYDCVWSSAGEGSDQIGRVAIFEQDSIHYVVSVMCAMEQYKDCAQQWDDLFSSIQISTDQ